MLHTIAQIGLFFNQPSTMIAIFLMGFFFINKKIFGHAMYLLLFTMIYNPFLKACWQIPLPAHMDGWAFPSGHMHCAFVFWGYLAYAYPNLVFRSAIGLILSLGGYGLLYSIYHTPIDILGAAAFGSLTLFIFHFVQKIRYFEVAPYRLGGLIIPICTVFLFLIPGARHKTHLWQGMAGLVILSFCWPLALRSRFRLLNQTMWRKHDYSIG